MSKELYDLCRRYKYFYKKHEDVKSWDNKYHDIDLSDAVRQTGMALDDIKDDLQKRLFKEYDVRCTNVELCTNYSMMYSRGSYFTRPKSIPSTASVELKNCDEFIRLLVQSTCRMDWSKWL